MTVLAADGMLVSLADTPANRAMFGSTGTADDSAPFRQVRVVALTARAGRAVDGFPDDVRMPGVPGDFLKRVHEQGV